MIHLRCLIGLHRVIWQPATAAPNTTWAPPVRVCRDCGHPIGRTHRD